MSGHSKWSNIHRKKEANDKVKAGIFTKAANAISIAVKKGGGVTDPDMNFSLRLAVENAKSVNMPKEKIERAIAKGSGKGEVNDLVELTIEGFGPGGVAIIAELVTNNRNRSVAELRTLMEKNGGRMGEMGSVAYMFEKKGMEYVPLYSVTVPNIEEAKAFIDLISEHDDVQEVYVNLAE